MPFYVSPEQIMRAGDTHARRSPGPRCIGAVRGRHPDGGAEPPTALHKISELYDRIAFAAGGRYSEALPVT
jgi:proteasome alpha subunit